MELLLNLYLYLTEVTPRGAIFIDNHKCINFYVIYVCQSWVFLGFTKLVFFHGNGKHHESFYCSYFFNWDSIHSREKAYRNPDT